MLYLETGDVSESDADEKAQMMGPVKRDYLQPVSVAAPYAALSAKHVTYAAAAGAADGGGRFWGGGMRGRGEK